MRHAKSKPTSSKYALVGLAAAVLPAAPAWAYVNGGDFHTTRHQYENRLRSAGWMVSCADPGPGFWYRTGRVAAGVTVAQADSSE
jgi:hypothetical protein